MDYSQYHVEQTQEITDLVTRTFSKSEGVDEGTLIGALIKDLFATTDPDDMFIFVAKDNDKIVGSIFFTRLTFEIDTTAFLLCPVVIDAEYQKKGVGQALINHAIEVLKQEGVELVFTYGEPKFYERVGFEVISEEQFKSPIPLSYLYSWLAQSLNDEALTYIPGRSKCVAALNNLRLW
ncbi:GNAT family N-acetyltransferase [Aliivibrio sp. S10_S31]|uniref:GNAT family N-acetyltransferase n=1 Tax=Aliivibrio sp. S10_S31 TaxID=2720224 RepID=UPI0016804DA3|nr:N-acetyltransferase [Aliivibrio sp. S10_S31]MBD1570314.1 N-acetyltransferase [Aliivibrio sp. S10_S31]